MKRISQWACAALVCALSGTASVGLTLAGSWNGNVGLSVDGIGSNASPVGDVQATIPVGATILKAFLYSAGTPFPWYPDSPTTLAAYNGAGKYLTTPANLLLAGKIVSVEARHAAAIRDIRGAAPYNIGSANTRFAGDDVVNAQGLDVVLEPATVRARVIASNFVSTTINVSGTLPAGRATPTITEFGPPNPTP